MPLEIQVGGGLDLKTPLRGSFKMLPQFFHIFDFTEETSTEWKKVVVFQSMHFLP